MLAGGADDIVELEIVREFLVADKIGDQRERHRGDDHRHDGKPVEPIGEIDRVGGACDHHAAHGDKEDAERDQRRLQERHREHAFQLRRLQPHQQPGGYERDTELDAEEPDQAADPAGRPLGDFEIVVGEAEQAIAHRHQQHDPDIAVLEIGPEQRSTRRWATGSARRPSSACHLLLEGYGAAAARRLRIGWPLPCFSFSQAMRRGPIRNATSSAVRIAPPPRKERYLNSRKNAIWSACGRSERN